VSQKRQRLKLAKKGGSHLKEETFVARMRRTKEMRPILEGNIIGNHTLKKHASGALTKFHCEDVEIPQNRA
jgi:hypothetical protein